MTTLLNTTTWQAVKAALGLVYFIVLVQAQESWAQSPGPAELAQERQAVQTWKEQRLASLTSETGWLTLNGLFWLKPGNNTFGSAKANSLHLDNASLPPQAGAFVLDGTTVHFVAGEGATVTHEGEQVSDIALAADTTGDPTLLHSGSLTFYLIERAGNLGIRVRDSNNPFLTNFHGLAYFPVDDSWVIDAHFEPYLPPRKVPIVNILGMREDMDAPGALIFTREGKEYRLDALREDPADTELFIMFADGTSGQETYGAGRFMYVPLPQDGRVRINFNLAYNPPCAFNTFATCPLPPVQNQLRTLRVEAGELTYVTDHGF